MDKKKLVVGIALIVVAIVSVVVMLALPKAGTPKPISVSSGLPEVDLCSGAPIVQATGAVSYPVANGYSNLRGLGMVLTASDCGNGRLAAMKKDFTYSLEGGSLKLVADPSADMVATMKRLGFACHGSAPESTCRDWKLTGPDPSLESLVGLKPFVGAIASEDCSSCG